MPYFDYPVLVSCNLSWFNVKLITQFSFSALPPDFFIYLLVYIDEILLSIVIIPPVCLRQHLSNHFQTKDLDLFKYFSGIVVAQSTTHATTTKLKYAKNYFRKPMRCLLTQWYANTPLDPNIKLLPRQWLPLTDPVKYSHLNISNSN